jgi:phenylacetate-coenzyme A ligase PaaK-like adenylate-forming protein
MIAPCELIAAWQSHRQRITLLRRPDALVRFLSHAVATVPHYKQGDIARRWAASARPTHELNLGAFALLTRAMLAMDPDAFVAAQRDGDLPLVPLLTSGSSGVPIRVMHDAPMHFHLTDGVYGSLFEMKLDGLVAPRPGALAVAIVSCKLRNSSGTRPLLSLGGAVACRVVLGRSDADDVLAVRHLVRQGPLLLHGRSADLIALWRLSSTLPHEGMIRPRAIVAAGANLFPDERALLTEAFQCSVFDSYSSTEGGAIATECALHVGLHVAHERLQVEVLTDDGAIAGEGTGELVITNLLNWGMPVIRYRTGDYATLAHKVCACGHAGSTITTLYGREARWFATAAAEQVGVEVLTSLLQRQRWRDYQFIQKGPGRFLVRFVSLYGQLDAVEESRLREDLAALVGDAEVELEAVGRLAEPEAKKRRFVIRY